MSQIVTLLVNNASPMCAYVSMPGGEGPFPAVMVFQEAFGVNHHIRSIADRMAELGYIAIAPEFFHRTAPPGFEAPYTDFASVAPHIQVMTTDNMENDIQATYDWLLGERKVQKNKIGCIGFCMGGRASFIANTFLPLQAAVSFYAGNMLKVVDRAPKMSAPHLFFWGGKDTHITKDQVDAVEQAVTTAGKEFVNVKVSYGDHGFFCDERAQYNPDAAREAWGMTTAFFKNKFDKN